MAFEKLNYSTEKQVDENSIQDKIDRKKITISQLTKSNLKNLKVDILNSKSSLNIRDIEGNIIGKLKESKVVNFSGDKKIIKYRGLDKVFLGVILDGGKIGYISADYVKGEIIKPIEKKPTITHDKVPDNQTGGKDGETTTVETNDNSYTDRYIFREGRILLVGKDGVELEQNRELSQKEFEIVKKYEKVLILNEVLQIWKNGATNTVNSLHWKDSRQDDENILKNISNIEEEFSKIFVLLQTGKIASVDKHIDNIFNNISKAENEEDIIGIDDMKEVKTTLLSKGNKNQKLIKIYNLMRYKGLSGNSNDVKEKVANQLLATDEFKSIKEKLSNDNLIKYISNNNLGQLSNLLNSQPLAKEFIEAYNTIKAKQEQNRGEYSKILVDINKKRKANNETEISLDEFIKMNVDYSVQTLIKHTLIESQVSLMGNRGSESDSYTGIYANMSGLSENDGIKDWFVINDENIDTAIDIGATLALSAVSMGVGMLAAKGAMMVAGNIGTKLSQYALYKNTIGGISTAAGITRFAGVATVEGLAFYEGTTFANNMIYGNNDWNYEMGNFKEMSKSIAFMGVLRGVGKVVEAAGTAQMNSALAKTLNQQATITKTEKALAGLGNLTTKVPPLMLKGTSISGVLAEAGLLMGTSQGLEVAFGGDFHPTWEEYLQSVVMVGLFRGISRGVKEIEIKKVGKELMIDVKHPKVEKLAPTEKAKIRNLKIGEKIEMGGKIIERTKNGEYKYGNEIFEGKVKAHLIKRLEIAVLKNNGGAGNIVEAKKINTKELKIEDALKIDKGDFSLKKTNKGTKKETSIREEKVENQGTKKEKPSVKEENIEKKSKKSDEKKEKKGKEEKKGTEKEKDTADKKKKKGAEKETKETKINKEKIEKMSAKDIANKLSKLKGWEKFKELPVWKQLKTVEFLKSLIKSSIFGGTTSVLIHQLFTDWEEGSTASDKIYELVMVFAGGAALGATFAIVGKGLPIIYKVGKGLMYEPIHKIALKPLYEKAIKPLYEKAIKPVGNFVWKNKYYIGGIGTVGYIANDIVENS